jgi:hypothetical protein
LEVGDVEGDRLRLTIASRHAGSGYVAALALRCVNLMLWLDEQTGLE